MIIQSYPMLSTINERISEVLVSRGKAAEVLDHIKLGTGKMLRPLLILLTVKLSGGLLTPMVNAKNGVELIHTASLIHDDVIDNGIMRRGKRLCTANMVIRLAWPVIIFRYCVLFVF